MRRRERSVGHKTSFTKAQVWLRRSQNWVGGSTYLPLLWKQGLFKSHSISYHSSSVQGCMELAWETQQSQLLQGNCFLSQSPHTTERKTKTPSYGWAQGGHVDNNYCLCVCEVPCQEEKSTGPFQLSDFKPQVKVHFPLASEHHEVELWNLPHYLGQKVCRTWGVEVPLTPDDHLASGPSAPYP